MKIATDGDAALLPDMLEHIKEVESSLLFHLYCCSLRKKWLVAMETD